MKMEKKLLNYLNLFFFFLPKQRKQNSWSSEVGLGSCMAWLWESLLWDHNEPGYTEHGKSLILEFGLQSSLSKMEASGISDTVFYPRPFLERNPMYFC